MQLDQAGERAALICQVGGEHGSDDDQGDKT